MNTTTLQLGLLPGDGIGPEIVPAARTCLDAAIKRVGAPAVEWKQLPLGGSAIETHGSPVPDETLAALEELDAWLLGPHDSVSYPEPFRSSLNPSGTIRKRFGLFANIRPAKAFAGNQAMVPGTDLVIARENTEGFYADRNTYAGTGEMMPTPDVAIAHGIITREASEKIAREAFALAQNRRKHVTIVHKANVLRLTTGLFREACYAVAKEFPDVTVDDFHIDAMTVHLLRRAPEFDVIVTENMFGDILSDLTGELAGSLGIAPSINSSDSKAMAQASHGSAPDIAGQDLANPIAMILSGSMLLQWLGNRRENPLLLDAARLIESGVNAAVESGRGTPDIDGSDSTSSFGAAVAALIEDL